MATCTYHASRPQLKLMLINEKSIGVYNQMMKKNNLIIFFHIQLVIMNTDILSPVECGVRGKQQ